MPDNLTRAQASPVAVDEDRHELAESSPGDEPAETLARLRAALAQQRQRAERAEAAITGVYFQRAYLTALVAQLIADRPDGRPAVLAYNSDADPETCPPDWPLIYLELPGAGQICYHLTPAQLPLFSHVETVAPDDPRARWDGEDKNTHHRRILQFIAANHRRTSARHTPPPRCRR
ncbi:hypothetical protein [Nocardia africana]|uniref:Uncharacterized protein n=1 Tax=Nocardia africana TaxID=134964 RepID=A0A379X6M7_9NOCA|nr:hypothetical protein [Nocardia africana]MCC3318455.1 hypothetical protein [Nocardia africana]SUH71948.1 Uncharacterised protein [Nocardia africana]